MKRGFVTVNGTRLHYLDFGGTGEPVVLLAGHGNTAWIWSDFGPRFEREHSARWTAESIAQFESQVQSGRVQRVAGIHHLFLDRPDETLRLTRNFLHSAHSEN